MYIHIMKSICTLTVLIVSKATVHEYIPILRVRVRIKEVGVYSRVYSHVPTRVSHKLYSYSHYSYSQLCTRKNNRKSVSVHTRG